MTRRGDELKQAGTMAMLHGDSETGDRLDEMGRSLSQESRTNAAVADFAEKARGVVPSLLGGGREDWNGKVDLFNGEDQPAIAAALNWDGTMQFQRELAAKIRDDAAGTGRIEDPQPYVTALHELIHGIMPEGRETAEWKALAPEGRAVLAAFSDMDKANPSGGVNPTLHTLADAQKRNHHITQATIDDLAGRGLLEKSSSTSSTGTRRPDSQRRRLTRGC